MTIDHGAVLDEMEHELKYMTSVVVGHGCKKPCDFSGRMEIVEPTTGRITGHCKVCKTCGAISCVGDSQ